MIKEITMKRVTLIAISSLVCLLAGNVMAQQDQTNPNNGQQTQNQPAAPNSSGDSGTSGASEAAPPVAGRTTLGIAVTKMNAIVKGWSVQRDLLGKPVMNDQKERIGKIVDLIITPSADVTVPFASYAIVGVGGFLGVGRNDVAIPMERLQLTGNELILPGATKDALKVLPKFEYARK
jgi:hypothetical protein